MTSATGLSDTDIDRRLASAAPVSFWLDRPDAPPAAAPLAGVRRSGLTVVGGGFAGLWTALLARRADPSARVVLLEAGRVAGAATGRNGGFCDASLTHGETNGRRRFGAGYDQLAELGADNLAASGAFVDGEGIDCGWEPTGLLEVATEEWHLAGLRPDEPGLLDAPAVRRLVASPTYLAGRLEVDGCVMVDPVGLAWGLRRACLEAGVEIFEHTPVLGLDAGPAGVEVRTDAARVTSERVVLATNAYPSLLRRVRPYVIPVYDHVLVTEPLSDAQMAGIGWEGRHGIADTGNQFHYYRLTADNRILWGGYETSYHYGRRVRPAYDQSPRVFAVLAEHFYRTFPQLADVGFTHRWGGAIDTCSRFCAFYGTAMGGRVAYAAGYTGLGVAATRFAALVTLDLLGGVATPLTELGMVRSRPVPFPPEPVGWAVIQATRWSIARADRHAGRRNAWLRTLDAIGFGFDS